MADFRRWILALALLVLVLGAVAPASAQPNTFQCTANAAVPPTMRQEGITELIGDIVLNCTGGTPTAPGVPVPQANITVFLSNPVTSRILSGTASEALLLVDEPDPAKGQVQNVCPNPTNPYGPPGAGGCQATGDGGASFATNGAYNVYQGLVTPGQNSVTFLGVPVDPPATAQTRVYRITNVRVNAGTSPVNIAGVSFVQGFISASPSQSIGINNPSPIVGFVSKGLNFSATGTGTAFLQCVSETDYPVGTVTYAENFATAFKYRVAQGLPLDTAPGPGLQYTPGAIYNTESGLVLPASGTVGLAGNAGLADWGTRFSATISNLPAGVGIQIDQAAWSPAGCTPGVNCTGRAVWVATSTTADPSPYGLAPDPGDGIVDVSSSIDSTGSVTVYWEVIASNPVSTDSFSFNIYTSFAGVAGSTPGLTVPTPPNVVGGFAPTSSTGSAVGIPTFVPGAPPPGTTLFTVSLCQTILLFPYVTDYPGFDTGIAISNTSADNLTLGASPQDGACSITFWGGAATTGGYTDTSANIGTNGTYSTTAQNFAGTGLVAHGSTWTFSLSGIDSTYGQPGALGLTGYAIATCDFQFAHGYSFVSSYALENPFAAAYLALIIPDAARAAQPFTVTSSGGQAGEQLVH